MRRGYLALLLLVAACDGVSTPPDAAMQEGGYVDIAAGGYHTCAVTAESSAYCWGDGKSGQLGNGGYDNHAWPKRVAGAERFTSVAAGLEHTCALAADGRLFCWGANWRGQIGDGTDHNRGGPVPVAAQLRFRQVSAGWFHTCAVDADGVAYCWGANGQGQLGREPGEDVQAPEVVPTPLQFRTIAAGAFHTCGVSVEGRAWCWGSNALGQLGTGSTTDSHEPREVTGGQTYADIAAGYSHSCGVRAGGQAVCWGSAAHGELGSGGSLPTGWGAPLPVGVMAPGLAAHVAAGHYVSCLIDPEQVVSCWGRGVDGQIGNGKRWDAWTPQYITVGDAGLLEPRLQRVSIGIRHACGVTQTRVAFCWGHSQTGQLGTGALTFSAMAVRVSAAR